MFKRILDNYIIAISFEIFKKYLYYYQSNSSLIFFVCLCSYILANESHSKDVCGQSERVWNHCRSFEIFLTCAELSYHVCSIITLFLISRLWSILVYCDTLTLVLLSSNSLV